jgi:Kef-type K+ transport system membrane component KefB
MNNMKLRSQSRALVVAGALTAALLASPQALADQGNIVGGFIEQVLLMVGLAIAGVAALVWYLLRKK